MKPSITVTRSVLQKVEYDVHLFLFVLRSYCEGWWRSKTAIYKKKQIHFPASRLNGVISEKLGTAAHLIQVREAKEGGSV